ncbi:MAG TPA: hypothetical protein VNO30_19280 [Kofleriaceae bacterium]|nr:hypothetical protein [Kofleriaceae bacterium]
MKLRAFLALALAATACGPSQPGDGDDGDDADGDGITDSDEGRATGTDTDRDGKPDYLDDDSDGDGIPDYREAGDTDLSTEPRDSDGDGKPDFRDLDSDENGRDDKLDGVNDVDNDGWPDFADLDDDDDAIIDLDEIGPNPAQPSDTDDDGTPDFRDTDSDDDAIFDLYETNADYDQDGAGNYVDLDSDGDCVSDKAEARGAPPADTDGDRRADFLDRDSDNDGVPDKQEDANCNGVVDPTETSSTAQDTDGDGVDDLVETAAGTDPLNPNSNPQANGDFVFVEPYMKPQVPADQNLDFSTQLQAVDLYVLLDRSGSMSTEIQSVRDNLASVVSGLKCPPGTKTNCIPDLWAGASTFGYSSSGVQAFQNWVDIQPNPSFATVPITAPSGASSAEVTTFATYAAITGQGGANYGLGGVPARATCAGSPAANAGYGTFGYPCFRQGALPVVLLATDEAPLSGSDVFKNPAWSTVVVPQYTAKKAKLVGVLGDQLEAGTQSDLQSMAASTGAIDVTNSNAPLVFSGAGTGAATAIRNGILALANGLPLDINAVSSDVPGDAVNAVTEFVSHIETLQLGTAACSNGLNDIDTDSDTHKDKYIQVRTGTPVCWKVVSKPNTTVQATDAPQLFRSKITVYGDGITKVDERDVFFLVPPRPIDGPIQ